MVFLTAGQTGKSFIYGKFLVEQFAIQDKEPDFQKFSVFTGIHQKCNYRLGLGKNVLVCLFLFNSFVEISRESVAGVLCSCFQNVLEKENDYCETA